VGESEFILAIIILFVLSLAAVKIGVAAIVGAFLAGMALSETVKDRERHLVHGVSELLIPFFLAGIGMKVDLSVFGHWPTLVLALALLGAAVVSKLAGCGIAGLGFGRANAIRIGVGMIPRGEVGMVVAQIGLSVAAITRPVYSVLVFMSVATTVIAPPLIRVAFKGVEPQFPAGQQEETATALSA
jgi:Kef-type K+ transport system membrane component KefB